MREINTLKTKSVPSNGVDVQKKITNGDKFATEQSEEVKTVKKVIRILISYMLVATKINLNINILLRTS